MMMSYKNLFMDKKLSRLVVFLSEKEFKIFKARLALEGVTMSDWIRKKISKYIREDI